MRRESKTKVEIVPRLVNPAARHGVHGTGNRDAGAWYKLHLSFLSACSVLEKAVPGLLNVE